MPKVSASWKASLPMSLVETWPVMATMGMESIMASTRPVVRLVAPGPEVAQQTPTLAGGAGVAFGGEGGILLVTHQDVTDVVVVEDVVKGEGDAAGVAEHAVHTLAGEAFQQHSCAAHQRRHRLMCSKKVDT